MKKILVGFLTLAAVFTVLPMFAAFEAHVINVTAKIENALNVPLEYLNFGTVFPQEHLDKTLDITLSNSFQEQDRVNTVDYIIRQKPKCAVTSNNGTVLVGPTWTGHVIVDEQTEGGYRIDCEQDKPADLVVPEGASYGLLPSLCEYISKHPDNQPENDGSLNSFHQAWEILPDGTIDWNDTPGTLVNNDDLSDVWTIDLAVPCFGGYCAQDWADFVHRINADANPDDYTQPIENEHKVFGCNLWVEVTAVEGIE